MFKLPQNVDFLKKCINDILERSHTPANFVCQHHSMKHAQHKVVKGFTLYHVLEDIHYY